MRSGATSSRQPRRRRAAIGLVLLAGVAAGGAVVVVRRIERDLDRRLARSLSDAGFADVRVPVRVQDGVYRTDTLALWLGGLVAAALVGLALGLLAGRSRRRTVEPDDAALLRQGWRLEPLAPAATSAGTSDLAGPDVPVDEPASYQTDAPAPAPEPEPEPVDALVFVVAPLVDPATAEPVGAPVGSARRAPSESRARPRREAVAPAERDDLTAISGIDADVAAVLRANGITTWARLGDTEVGVLRALLDGEGPRFRACQPGTWPIQGRLLDQGEWSAWRALVNGLRDGRPIWR